MCYLNVFGVQFRVIKETEELHYKSIGPLFSADLEIQSSRKGLNFLECLSQLKRLDTARVLCTSKFTLRTNCVSKENFERNPSFMKINFPSKLIED